MRSTHGIVCHTLVPYMFISLLHAYGILQTIGPCVRMYVARICVLALQFTILYLVVLEVYLVHMHTSVVCLKP